MTVLEMAAAVGLAIVLVTGAVKLYDDHRQRTALDLDVARVRDVVLR